MSQKRGNARVTKETSAQIRAGILSRSQAFGAISPAEMERLSARSVYRRFRPREELTRHGDRAEALIVIGRGRVKATLPSPETGTEFILGTFAAGDVVGEIAVLQNRPRVGGLVALSDAEVVLVPREALMDLLGRCPTVSAGLLDDVCGKLRLAFELCMSLRFLDLQSRFAQRLLYLGRTASRSDGGGLRIQHGLSQRELAGSIGASRESLNRLLIDWKTSGLVDYGRGFILVHDPQAVAQLLPEAIRQEVVVATAELQAQPRPRA